MDIIGFVVLSFSSILVGIGVAKLLTKAQTVADMERTSAAREMGLVAIAMAEQHRRDHSMKA